MAEFSRFGSMGGTPAPQSVSTSNPVELLVKVAIDNKASDIHVKTNRYSRVRVHTEVKVVEKDRCKVTADQLYDFCKKYMPNDHAKIDSFINGNIYSIDSTVVVYNRRLRLHLYKGQSGPCATLRLLSEGIPDLHVLNLPESIENFVHLKSGLVLITGATGSGKTTTIASVINEINKLHDYFILTIEDPVEYKYEEIVATIEQREVGHDVSSFSAATVDALREDPDVIVVGEMRDLDTIQNAIALAETGHLVFGTLHAKSVIDAIDRMIQVFPPIQQQQIRIQLSSVIAGIVHQQMVHANGKISVLVEMIQFDNVLANMIKSSTSSTSNIRDTMRSKTDIGCVHLVDNIFWHIQAGRLRYEDIADRLSEADANLLQTQLLTLKATEENAEEQSTANNTGRLFGKK